MESEDSRLRHIFTTESRLGEGAASVLLLLLLLLLVLPWLLLLLVLLCPNNCRV